MAWGHAVGQLTKDGADEQSTPLNEAMQEMFADLVEGGAGFQIGDTVFLRCARMALAIRADGSMEYSEPAA